MSERCENGVVSVRERVSMPVTIQNRDLALEGKFVLPPRPTEKPLPGVVVCHPHPLYGGDMENDVVIAICRHLRASGLSALRFNFRGVGRSDGDFDDGVGEQEDARAAISFLERRAEIDPLRIGICGYSFGSIVAFGVAATDRRVKAVAGISPFIRPRDILNEYERPKLFISGANDHLVDCEGLRTATSRLPGTCEVKIVADADHFWRGLEDVVATSVARFFVRALQH